MCCNRLLNLNLSKNHLLTTSALHSPSKCYAGRWREEERKRRNLKPFEERFVAVYAYAADVVSKDVRVDCRDSF
jgi:hypothetical protein